MNRLNACLVGLVGCCAALASDIPPPRAVDTAALVRQLASEDFNEREEASRRLAALHVDEPPAELLAALKSPDPEVRERAAKAVKAIRTAAAYRRMPRDERFSSRGKVDLYVASTAALNLQTDDARLWEPALDLGRVATAKAEMKGGRKPRGCPATFEDFPTYRKLHHPRLVRLDHLYSRDAMDAHGRRIIYYPEAIQASGVADPGSISWSLVLSRGDVSAKTVIGMSVILANGNVTTGDDIYSSVIICDGDVTISGRTVRSLIIARGRIKSDRITDRNTLIAGGAITITKPMEPVPKGLGLENVIKENEPNPLGFIIFFELSRVGLEVKAADKAVRVAKVAPGSVCEKAGLKAGDTVLDVGGKKPADAEALRRLLRDALALGDAAVKVKRGGETITLKLALPE